MTYLLLTEWLNQSTMPYQPDPAKAPNKLRITYIKAWMTFSASTASGKS